jgi:hypothetical protein
MHARTIADLLMNILSPDEATNLILSMHNTSDGADVLSLIVRDDISGAGDLIANALWFRIK